LARHKMGAAKVIPKALWKIGVEAHRWLAPFEWSSVNVSA
jgi:hypothetical protein